jgi:hypothetical protein
MYRRAMEARKKLANDGLALPGGPPLLPFWPFQGPAGGFPPPPSQHAPWASDDPAERPWAERDGNTITLRPSGVSFRVPKDWLEWHDNFHLSHRELDAVARGAGDWDTEYASVCNTVLPFDRCAAHVGEECWGAKGVSYADLQVRVYDLRDTPEAVEHAVETVGAADAERLGKHPPELRRDDDGQWRRAALDFPLWYGDYGGTACVDFRLRPVGGRTVVFVFTYCTHQEEAIDAVLDSFRSP